MANRIITATVTGETIRLSNKTAGSVQIGDRYFYIPGNGSICFECNAPA